MSRRGRRRRRHREEASVELELMPMLNVFISIIPLLLLSAAFVPVSIIQASLPGGGGGGGGAPAAATAPAKKPTLIEIVIRKDAYFVVVDGKMAGSVARPAETELGTALERIAARHPGERELRIVSPANTRYKDIVRVMDVSRAAGLPEAGLVEAAGEAS